MSLIQDKIKELEEKAKSYQDCSNFISYQWIQKDDYGSDLKVYESEPKREYRGKLKEYSLSQDLKFSIMIPDREIPDKLIHQCVIRSRYSSPIRGDAGFYYGIYLLDTIIEQYSDIKKTIIYRLGQKDNYTEKWYVLCKNRKGEYLLGFQYYVKDGKIEPRKNNVGGEIIDKDQFWYWQLGDKYKYLLDEVFACALSGDVLKEKEFNELYENYSFFMLPKGLQDLQNEMNKDSENKKIKYKIDKNNLETYTKLLLYKNTFNHDNLSIPKFAILGPAGVGKTSFAKVLAKLFGDKKLEICSPSDFKGEYTGQTQRKVYNVLKDASDNKKIILIDEVSNLLNDEFGREALDIILPILSGDKLTLNTPKRQDDDVIPETLDFVNNPVTIWISGYDIPTRQMLQKNLGLYRRLEIISLKTPTVDKLMDAFKDDFDKKCTSFNIIPDHQIIDKKVRNFVSWATSPEYSLYFANYAGIEKISKTLVSTLLLVNAEKSPIKTFDDFFNLHKREIESQYCAALLMPNNGNESLALPAFKTASDFPDIEVIGYKNVTERLDKLAYMIFEKAKYKEKGISISKGMLFVGPPGTGKSHMAKYMSFKLQKEYRSSFDKDHRVGFIPVVATQLRNPDKVKALFETAKDFDDCIIFIDEIDAIGKRRQDNPYEEAMIELMTSMDGFDSSTGIFILAATNAPEVLDPALKRAGRFDDVLEIGYPVLEDRKKLLRHFLEKKTDWTDCVKENERKENEIINDIAAKAAYMPAVQIKNLVDKAALIIDKPVSQEYSNENNENKMDRWHKVLKEVVDTIQIGERREINEEDMFNLESNKGASATAIHEVGHALAYCIEFPDDKIPFDEITVIPRGEALGYVKHSIMDNHALTKDNLLKSVRIKLAGRAAEELFWGADGISPGAVTDIAEATGIVRNMVTRYGMSEKIGPVALVIENNSFLDNSSSYVCSDSMRTKAEEEIQRILNEQYIIVLNTLKNNKDKIENLAKQVFEIKSMSGEAFKDRLKCSFEI